MLTTPVYPSAFLFLFLAFFANNLDAQPTVLEMEEVYTSDFALDGTWLIDAVQSASEADNDFWFAGGFTFREDGSVLRGISSILSERPDGFVYQLGLDSLAGFRIESVGEVSYALAPGVGDTLFVKDPYLITNSMGVRRLVILITNDNLKDEFRGTFTFEITETSDDRKNMTLTSAILRGEYTLCRKANPTETFFMPQTINVSDQLNYLHFFGKPAEVITNYYDAERTRRGSVAIGRMQGQTQHYFGQEGELIKSNQEYFDDALNTKKYASRYGGHFRRAYETYLGEVDYFVADSIEYIRDDTSEVIRYLNGEREIMVIRGTLVNGRVVSTLVVKESSFASSDGSKSRPVHYRYDSAGNLKYTKQTTAYREKLRITYYRYLAFDATGNWTRREVFTDFQMYKPQSVETRAIRYH